ncbi:MAG: heme-binding protein [Chloroflexota bacterium]|nr:heme-binding protein [Chloroflexota bacterium]
MSIDVARRILEASKQRARELRSPVSIAIVDDGGHLVLFERMMSPYGWATGNISIAKATTAVMFNQSTDNVAQWGAGIPGFASSLSEMTHGKFVMAAGGWPVKLSGATVGGIGVSGGNAPGRDDEIARAGLAAAEAMVRSQPQPAAEMMAPPISALPQSPLKPPTYSPAPAYPPMPQTGNMGMSQGNSAHSINPPSSQYLSPEQPPIPHTNSLNNVGLEQSNPVSSQYLPPEPSAGQQSGNRDKQQNASSSPNNGTIEQQEPSYNEDAPSLPFYTDNTDNTNSRPGGQS